MEEPSIKRLYRSRTDRMIAGICGGIGEYLSVDPNILRVVWLLFGLTGTGLIAYILAWIIIPEAPPETETPQKSSESTG